MKLTDIVEYQSGKIARQLVAESEHGMMAVMAFDKGVELGTHTAPAVVVVQILEGVCEFTLDGELQRLSTGESVVMKPGTPHSLRAPERFKMLLTKLA